MAKSKATANSKGKGRGFFSGKEKAHGYHGGANYIKGTPTEKSFNAYFTFEEALKLYVAIGRPRSPATRMCGSGRRRAMAN